MAIYRSAIFNELRKKLANTVMYKLESQGIMRSAPGKIKNPRTPEQLTQRAKISLLGDLGRRFAPIIKEGFRERPKMNSVSVFEVLFISLSRSLKTINNMKNSGFTFRKRLASFRYAFNGIRLLIQKEHNAWIHCFATICVIIAGFSFGLSQTEWMAVVIVIGAVLSAEAINSSIESLADLVSPEYNEAIKKTKDLAAGAVLIMAIAAAIVGSIIFFPKLGF